MADRNWFSTVVAASLMRRRGCAAKAREPGAPCALCDCPPGDGGVIVDVCGEGPLASRLREMGVVPGVRIRVLRGGNPIVFQIAEGRYCIRRRDARCLMISRG